MACILNSTGEVLLSFACQDLKSVRKDSSAFIIKRDNKFGIINLEGEQIIEDEYLEIKPTSKRHIYIAKGYDDNNYLLTKKGYKYNLGKGNFKALKPVTDDLFVLCKKSEDDKKEHYIFHKNGIHLCTFKAYNVDVGNYSNTIPFGYVMAQDSRQDPWYFVNVLNGIHYVLK